MLTLINLLIVVPSCLINCIADRMIVCVTGGVRGLRKDRNLNCIERFSWSFSLVEIYRYFNLFLGLSIICMYSIFLVNCPSLFNGVIWRLQWRKRERMFNWVAFDQGIFSDGNGIGWYASLLSAYLENVSLEHLWETETNTALNQILDFT